jgi:cysteinyl-tRNA synthetase
LKDEEEKNKINPKEMFLANKDYSKFDENGIPTHNAKGDELGKKPRVKCEGIWAKQNEKYQKWLSAQGVPAEPEMITETPKAE